MSSATSVVSSAALGAPGRRVLYIPEEVTVVTWRALRGAARLGCESTVRWAGPAHQLGTAAQVATTVVVPAQRIAPGRFDVPHAATREMGDALRATKLVNLAQLHTHPQGWAGHSAWDDDRAYSSRDGALSIVWPFYARGMPDPSTWGVHECRARRWVELAPEEAAARVVVLPSVLDLRCGIELLENEWDEEEDGATRSVSDHRHISGWRTP